MSSRIALVTGAGRAFEHTVIASELEGLGLASQLIRHALAETGAAGLQPQRFGLTIPPRETRLPSR